MSKKYINYRDAIGSTYLVINYIFIFYLLLLQLPILFPTLFFCHIHLILQVLFAYFACAVFAYFFINPITSLVTRVIISFSYSLCFINLTRKYQFDKALHLDALWLLIISILFFTLILKWQSICYIGVQSNAVPFARKNKKKYNYNSAIFQENVYVNHTAPVSQLSNYIPTKNITIINLYSKDYIYKKFSNTLFNEKRLTRLKTENIFTEKGFNRYLNVIKGIHGENNILKQLEVLNIKNAICLHNACFRTTNVAIHEFDFILITSYCIFIIESKYRSCENVIFNGSEYFEQKFLNKKEEKQENPLIQLLAQKNHLTNILKSRHYNIPIYAFLVYSGLDNMNPKIEVRNDTLIECKFICNYSNLSNRLMEQLNKCQNPNRQILSYDEIKELSTSIQNLCYFPYKLFLPKEDYFVNADDFNISNCQHKDIMIPMYSQKTNRFILVCPKSYSLDDDSENWSCPHKPL